MTWNRASFWASPIDLALVNLKNHPNSARWHFETGLIYEDLALQSTEREQEFVDIAIKHFRQSSKIGIDHQAAGLIAIVHMSAIHTRDIRASLLTELKTALSSAKVGATTILNLEQLTLCVAHRECYLPYETINSLHRHLMTNPVISNSARGRLKADLAQLALNTNRLDAALDLLQQAVEDNPTHVQHYLNLAYVQILKGQTEPAKSVLEHAAKIDWTGNYKSRIATLTDQLQDAYKRRDKRLRNPLPDEQILKTN